MRKVLLVLLLSLMMGCSTLDAISTVGGVLGGKTTNGGINTDAQLQLGKDNSKQGVVGHQQDQKINAEDGSTVEATTSSGDGIITGKTIGKATTTKAKNIKSTAVKAETVENVKTAEKQQDVKVGDNAHVTIIQNEGTPWWMIVLLVGALALPVVFKFYSTRKKPEPLLLGYSK